MKKLGEQWIENGRMRKAISGNNCEDCAHNIHEDYCQAPSMQGGGHKCPVGEGLIIKDLGIVN